MVFAFSPDAGQHRTKALSHEKEAQMGFYEDNSILTAELPTFSTTTQIDNPAQTCFRCWRRRDVLTPQEIQAARGATYFETGLWGSDTQGWSPEAMVAQMRGVVFHQDTYGFCSPDDIETAQQALEDVATFLGFTDVDAYLNAVMREQEIIIDRFRQPLL
jgi:hypothetical protein